MAPAPRISETAKGKILAVLEDRTDFVGLHTIARASGQKWQSVRRVIANLRRRKKLLMVRTSQGPRYCLKANYKI